MSKMITVKFLEMSNMNVPTNDSELKLIQDYAQQHNLLINTKNSEIKLLRIELELLKGRKELTIKGKV